MEYTVGSLADLISGKETPNKPKVKKVKIKVNKEESEEVVKNVEKKKKKVKKDGQDKIVNGKKQKSKDLTPTSNKKRKREADSLADNDVEEDDQPETNSTEETVPKKKIKRKPDPEELARTIFVGNVPLNTTKKKIKQHFKKYGSIEALRFRGIPVANPKVPKKVAAIKKEFHPDRHTVNCYIRFTNKEDAKNALVEDGALFEEYHLRVHGCDAKEKPDESKAIFIGNLSFKAEEEDLWKLFETCGPISHVRIIRDQYTGMGKGFAYVNFKDSDSVQLALEMENVKLGNRELRIKPSSASTAKKNKANPKLKSKPRWRNRNGTEKDNNESAEGNKKFKSKEKMQNKNFQGAKFNIKKKNKVNKGLLEKKKNVKKIAPIAK